MRKQGQMDEQAEEGSQIMKRKEWQMDAARRAAYGGPPATSLSRSSLVMGA